MAVIEYVKHDVTTTHETPQEWINSPFDEGLVKKHLIDLGVVKEQEHLTIHLWRKSNESDFSVREDDKIFVCYNLRNAWNKTKSF